MPKNDKEKTPTSEERTIEDVDRDLQFICGEFNGLAGWMFEHEERLMEFKRWIYNHVVVHATEVPNTRSTPDFSCTFVPVPPELDIERLAEVAYHSMYPSNNGWKPYRLLDEEAKENHRESVRDILKELGHEGEGGPVLDTSRCLCPKCGALSVTSRGCPYCGCTEMEWNRLKAQEYLDRFNQIWPDLRDEYTLCIIDNKALWPSEPDGVTSKECPDCSHFEFNPHANFCSHCGNWIWQPPSEPDNKDSKHQADETALEELAEHLYFEHAEGLGLALDDIHPFQGLISQQKEAWLAVARAVLEDRG